MTCASRSSRWENIFKSSSAPSLARLSVSKCTGSLLFKHAEHTNAIVKPADNPNAGRELAVLRSCWERVVNHSNLAAYFQNFPCVLYKRVELRAGRVLVMRGIVIGVGRIDQDSRPEIDTLTSSV